MADVIRDLGVALLVGSWVEASLPRPPPRPQMANLDVTAMCAAVSQVGYSSQGDERVRVWSEGNEHIR